MKRLQPDFDPVTLEIYRALYTSVAEEMGITLRRTAHSPNIKERRDYSCAVFDAAGRVIAQGDHMPVHLGSMPLAVAAALRETRIEPGDCVALNDPFAGGTHLPDVTLVAGVFAVGEDIMGAKGKGERGKVNTRSRAANDTKGKDGAAGSGQGSAPGQSRVTDSGRGGAADSGQGGVAGSGLNLSPFPLPPSPLFYVANRAHHADIGGGSPGSMGMATDIYGEGLRIPPIHLLRGGRVSEDVMRLLLANVRGADERRADFAAQIGSLKTGATRLLEIVARAGTGEAAAYAAHLIRYSARIMRAAIREIPDGIYEAEDALDDDGVGDRPCVIRVRVEIKGERARIDFTGSAAQVAGPVNAVEAITVSAVAYVFRCLLGAGEIPASAGLMEPLEIVAPRGTIVNALPPAPVAGGNVETSQRIVDALFKALSRALPGRIPAASQGTMNNLTIGGIDACTGREFAYYETVAGGMGARPALDGLSAVHTHMTNSLNTPVEALEYAYPLRVRRYAIRANSGGRGRQRGGDGVVREIETLVDARMSLLADRRVRAPYGLAGGEDGQTGRDAVVRVDANGHAHARRIPAKGSRELKAGERIRIETPGGGGHGRADALTRKKKAKGK
ncbi:MAG TPA: hydantoinase B/oxoprolinase family protein [Pyrinomonadaceae bacterium]|nr:hydantoinase B/oxoprolinase family protein [Pyrinomonadaceae bacterium]